MPINNPHDRFFRSSMSNLTVAQEFFSAHLPAKILKQADLSTLKMQSQSFIDADYKEFLTDILYQVDFDRQHGYFYILIEHQSKPQRMMPFRVLSYIIQIMRRHIDHLKYETLPIVVPLVFYHGQQEYSYSTDIFDLYGDHKELAKSIFLQPFHLVDMTQFENEALSQRTWSGVMEFMQKNIFETAIPASSK